MALRFFRSIILVALIAASAAVYGADDFTRFDFEDGTLQGWTIISGEAGKLPTGPETARPDVQFNQQGKYFIGTYENPARDNAQITLQSPVFTVKSDVISLLVSGGNRLGHCYVALYKASDNSEITRNTGYSGEMFERQYWDVSAVKGQQVYIKIVDISTANWGHINVDDIRELTQKEIKDMHAEKAAKAKRYAAWLVSTTAPSKRIIHSGDALADIAMPLGGIGSGHVSICGDGAVRQWSIFNVCNERCVVPHSFFAIRTKTAAGKTVAKLLQQTSVDNLPAIDKVEFIGEYPIAQLKFIDSDLPVRVSLRAFSPYIPMNDKDSAIPAAIFEYTIENTGTEQVDISLLSTLQNAAGYDGLYKIIDTWHKAFGGNVNSAVATSNMRGVFLSNPTYKLDHRNYGTMFNGALDRNAETTAQWDDVNKLWASFSRSGSITSAGEYGSSQPGRTWDSAVTVPATLRPGQKVVIPFVWTWHFPNLYVWWDDREGQPTIGRMYSNWFSDAQKTAEYVAANYSRLSGDTEKFRRAFYKTTLPYWMLDRISAQNSTIVSTVCMWIKDGSFVGFEGTGCCPMNCTHVWNYEQQLAYLFPTIERNMRDIDLNYQQMPSGGVHHRTRLPLSLPRENEAFVDGHLGTILKAYREYRQSADRQWLDKMWPKLKLAMEFVLNDWDPNKDGVLVNEQWNTYDSAMYGPNTFIGTLYLCALRASEEMAKVEGDNEFASRLHSIFEIGSKRLNDVCWNGEYYQQIEAKPAEAEVGENKWLLEDWPTANNGANRPYGKGCHADQLLGQWWATQLDLGYLLPKDRVQTSLNSIMKYNWVEDFSSVIQNPRAFAGKEDPGLYNCTWPKGGRPPVDMLYSFEVWTGIEYEVAGLMLQEGFVERAYQIVKACSDRYNGVQKAPIQRNPWAEVECSNHYARAMSAWGMLLAAQGYNYCGPDKALEFNPIVTPDNHTSFFTCAEGWGLFSQKRSSKSQVNTLELDYGQLELKKLTLHLPESAVNKAVKVRSSGNFTQSVSGDAITIEFSEPVRLKADEGLRIAINW